MSSHLGLTVTINKGRAHQLVPGDKLEVHTDLDGKAIFGPILTIEWSGYFCDLTLHPSWREEKLSGILFAPGKRIEL